MMRTITVYTEVEVDVDLSRFSTGALLEELEDRREEEAKRRLEAIKAKADDFPEDERYFYIPTLKSGEKHDLHAIYYALKFGKPEHAADLMRDYVSDMLGVVL